MKSPDMENAAGALGVNPIGNKPAMLAQRPPKIKRDKFEVLVVDDDGSLLEVVALVLEEKGYHVVKAISGEIALEVLKSKNFDLVITDLCMGKVDGMAVLKEAKKLNVDTVVMIMTGNNDISFAIQALRNRADDYLLKPFGISELLTRVSHCIDNRMHQLRTTGDGNKDYLRMQTCS
jgi:DNA-binding response OmpR family regulator